MERNIDLKEVSDGRLYGLNDMVKADCRDCEGCSACCRGMGSSVVLDPLDIYRMSAELNLSFEGMIDKTIELNVVDGVILPNLKMDGDRETCVFLNDEGRCRIHAFRPGICRIFPLGRLYEDHSFQYFLQVKECPKENRGKVKVKKWIDTPDVKRYETFITDWHYYLKEQQKTVKNSQDQELIRAVSLHLLQEFYLKAYQTSEDFYDQFYERLTQTGQEEVIG